MVRVTGVRHQNQTLTPAHEPRGFSLPPRGRFYHVWAAGGPNGFRWSKPRNDEQFIRAETDREGAESPWECPSTSSN